MKKIFLVLVFAFIFLPSWNKTKAANQFDVLINEIAWMGSANSANDEWLELFNNTDNLIDLSSWILKSGDENIKISLEGTIPAKGFYLLERTDNSSVPNVEADFIYKGALLNSGANLILYDNSNRTVDQANHQSGWQAGDNITKQTMERLSLKSWQTSQKPNGTPKAENSATENPQPQEPASQAPGLNSQNVTNNQITNYPEGVVINEFLPAPNGPDENNEWIELYNKNDFSVDLSNWKLRDTEGITTTYFFPNDLKISANGYVVVKRPETKILLNNDKDGLELMRPDGKIIDSVVYQKALVNQSYNRIESQFVKQPDWQWSTILTPGVFNNITVPPAQKELKVLPKPEKSDSKINKELATVSEPLNQIISLQREKENDLNPWPALLTTLVLIVISGATVIIWKFKK